MSDWAMDGSPVTEGAWAGWSRWTDPHPDTFLQAIGQGYLRSDARGFGTVGLETRSSHRNRLESLHGGFLAAFADHAYFGALWAMGHAEQVNGVTLDLTMQYLAAGRVGPPLFAEVELLRETGQLMFLRMTIQQNDAAIAASTATLRKARPPR